MRQMTTNSNCPSTSLLNKRFNEINLKSFSETNVDKKEWLNKHEKQRGGNKEVAEPEGRLQEFTQGHHHQQHVAFLMKYHCEHDRRRAAAIYLTGSKPSVITLLEFAVLAVDPSNMLEVLII